MKRFFTLFLLMLGMVPLQAQTQDPTFLLYIAKIELSGEVKLVWTKPMSMSGSVHYQVYRAMVSDSSSFTLVKSTDDNYYVDKVPTVVTSISNSYAYYVLATWGHVTVKSNTQLLPVPVVPPFGSFHLSGKFEATAVTLAWEEPPVQNVSHYIVRGGHAAIAAPLLPRLDSTVNQTASIPLSMLITPEMEKTPLAFYVVAHLTTGEVITSTYLQMTYYPPEDRDEVKFVSRPPLYAQVGKKYEYTAVAHSSDPAAVVRYSALFPASALGFAFSIDSVSGVVDWTPTAKGMFRIAIVARSNKGGYAKQEFAIGVSNGNGIIQGKVTDTLNLPIANTVIELFKTANDLFNSYSYIARTDANGNYKIVAIDPGTYKLKANSPSSQYQSQWYDGKQEASQADVITVQDSPSVTIANVKLRGGPAIRPKVTVTGTVKDTLGLAINGANARVIFVRAEFALNLGAAANITMENFRKYFELNSHVDFRLEGNSEFVVKAPVDTGGNYSVQLVPGRYIAFARAHGYATEFYFEKPDLLSADIFLASDEALGLQIAPNFTLAPLPPIALGEIKGAVLDSVNDIAVPSRVIAFRDGWRFNDHHRIARVYVTDTDSNGTYEFTDLLPGTYVVMAVPLGNYPPAFYVDHDTVNYRWKRASKIVINGNSVDDINIYVKRFGLFNNGYTSIFGSVTYSGQGSGGMNNSVKAGALVYAYRNGEFAGYTMTNAEGNYSINGLAAGYYYVFVDRTGFNESSTVMVNTGYDGSGNPVGAEADFTISSAMSVTSDRTVTPETFVLEQNYPNPFNPSTTIRYALPASGNVTLTVYDLLGKEVAALVNEYQQAGQYTVTFNASRLSSGLYFYRLESGSAKQVKKMVLLK